MILNLSGRAVDRQPDKVNSGTRFTRGIRHANPDSHRLISANVSSHGAGTSRRRHDL